MRAYMCPTQALLHYLQQGGGLPGPLFLTQRLQPLRRRQFVAHIQQALDMAGIKGRSFNGHCFRIGAATSVGAAGIPESIFKPLGQWESSAYQ